MQVNDLNRAPDLELIERSKSGEHRAFEVLWRRHYTVVQTAIYGRANGESEDIATEAFAVIWNQLQQGKVPKQHFRAYVVAIARNLAAKHHRQHHVWVAQREPHEDDFTVTDVDPVKVEEQAHIADAFSTLPLASQQVLWLLEVEQLPRQAVAEQLDKTPNAVTVIARRARQRLAVEWLIRQVPTPHALEADPFAKDLPRYVRGMLAPNARRVLSQHLATCAECSAYLTALQSENQRLNRKGLAPHAFATALIATATIPLLPEMAQVGRHTAPFVSQPFPAEPLNNSASGSGVSAATHSPIAKFAAVAALLVTIGTASLFPMQKSEVKHAGVALNTPWTMGEIPSPSAADSSDAQERPAESEDSAPSTTATTDTPAEDPSPIAETEIVNETVPHQDPPDTSAPTPLSYTLMNGSPAPTLHGTASPGSTNQVVDPSGMNALTTGVDETGAWVLDLGELDLPPGAHTVAIVEIIGGAPARSVTLSFVSQ